MRLLLVEINLLQFPNVKRCAVHCNRICFAVSIIAGLALLGVSQFAADEISSVHYAFALIFFTLAALFMILHVCVERYMLTNNVHVMSGIFDEKEKTLHKFRKVITGVALIVYIGLVVTMMIHRYGGQVVTFGQIAATCEITYVLMVLVFFASLHNQIWKMRIAVHITSERR